MTLLATQPSGSAAVLSYFAERMLKALRRLTAEREPHRCGGFTTDDMQWMMGTAFTPQETLWEALEELEKAGFIRFAGEDEQDAIGTCYELCEGRLGITDFVLVDSEQIRPLSFVEEAEAVTAAQLRKDPIYLSLVRRLADAADSPCFPRRMNNLFSALWTHLRSPGATHDNTAPMKTASLTHAQQSAILNRCQWTPDGKVSVLATHRSVPLLRLAGISCPEPLTSYPVPVKRDASGFLIVDRESKSSAGPSGMGMLDDEIFQAGGLLAGLDGAPIGHSTRVEKVDRGALAELCEVSRTRIFEVSVHEGYKIRVSIVAFQDVAPPAPQEPECWEPHKPTDGDIHSAVQALHMARSVQKYEQV